MKKNSKQDKAEGQPPAPSAKKALNINAMIESAGKKLEGLQSWVEFEEMDFLFNFMPRAQFKKLAQKCTAMKYDQNKRTREETVDAEKLNKLLIEAVIVDWRKVTPRSLSKVLAIDVSDLSDDELDEALDFDSETVRLLAEHAYGFEQFLQDVCMDQSYFSPHAEEEAKNSETSQTGS